MANDWSLIRFCETVGLLDLGTMRLWDYWTMRLRIFEIIKLRNGRFFQNHLI